MMVQTKCKLNNTELSASVKLFHIRPKKLGTTRTTKKQQDLKNGILRFRLNIYIRKEIMGRLKAECHKTSDSVRKRPTEFQQQDYNSRYYKVPLTESLLDNQLKNNHITVDKIYYLRSLFVSFFTNFSFQIYFSTAENRKTEFCGNALKLDLID